MSEKQKSFPIMVVLVSLVFLVIGFGLRIVYQKHKISTTFSNHSSSFTNQRGQGLNRDSVQGPNQGEGLNRGQISGFRQTLGEITSIDDTSITVKTTDGGSKIIFISDSTTINKSSPTSKDDLQVGSSVAIRANENSDGTSTAENIEINPGILSN